MTVIPNFYLGPEIPKPPRDPALTWALDVQGRRAWQDAIADAIREHDAWGLLCTAPNCDITLRDVLTGGSTWEATRAHSIHLLLVREKR